MGKIKWDDSLSVGIDLIDKQHKMLIERLGQLARAASANEGAMKISQILDFLVDYTDFHFSTEEKYMAQHNYPGLQEQIVQHDQFRKSIQAMVQEFREEGATPALAEAVNSFLGNWLVKHIETLDRRFGAFLEKEGT